MRVIALGTVTPADLLAPGEAAAICDWASPALAHLDYLLSDEEQVLGLAAALGCALAALVAEGPGSDHGYFDPAAAESFAASTPTQESALQ